MRQELGVRYCVAMNSCGSTMFVALKSAGVRPGDAVLSNCFTLAPVPGAIAHAGARPVLVDVTDDYTIDLDDLERKAAPAAPGPCCCRTCAATSATWSA